MDRSLKRQAHAMKRLKDNTSSLNDEANCQKKRPPQDSQVSTSSTPSVSGDVRGEDVDDVTNHIANNYATKSLSLSIYTRKM